MPRKKPNCTVKYGPEIRARIIELAQEGLTNKEISEKIGISDRTLYTWRKENPTLDPAMIPAKKYADDKIVDSLYKRAQGYEITETRIIDSEKNGHTQEEITKHIPASDTAMIFWLKNRRWNEWKDRRVVELSGDVNYVEKRKELDNIKSEIEQAANAEK
jgi:hypothetical protein